MWEVYHEAEQEWPFAIRRTRCSTKIKAYEVAATQSVETGRFVAVHRRGIEIASFLRGKCVREC